MYLTDRTANLIISGGVNIYPAEVDAVLLEHPAVGDVGDHRRARRGVGRDRAGGRAAGRGCRGRTTSWPSELLAFCRDRLAHFKCPRAVDFVRELPREDTGKIFKRKLRDHYREAQSRGVTAAQRRGHSGVDARVQDQRSESWESVRDGSSSSAAAGRGIGREHALAFAREGAKLVVNDLGAEIDGTGSSTGPAGEVVDEVRAMGGEAVANGDDVSDYDGRRSDDPDRRRHLRHHRRAGEQRGHPARPHARQHDHRRVGCRDQGAPARHVRPDARTPSSTGATVRRRARPTTPASSTPPRPRGSTATSARPTTGRPRPGSPPSRSSRPWSWDDTASPSTPSRRPPSPG